MWIPLTIYTLFLITGRGCQGASEVPKNHEEILTCSETCYPQDCADVASVGSKADGVYLIYPGGKYSNPVPVYCDMTTKDGPWTVFQKRFDGKVSFYRDWKGYKAGFGRADGEYWLGLQNIYLLTLRKTNHLRVTLVDWDGVERFVTYEDFSLSRLAVDPEEDGYKLYLEGFKEGDPTKPAGNPLTGHVGMKFSTYDNDRDISPHNCAELYHGAFWYFKCHGANLNGRYQNGTTTEYATGLVWASWKGAYYSFKKTTMMISPSVPKA
ncbi:microfibril-associated glycoprotein 4-like [Mantella aurantiaca]